MGWAGSARVLGKLSVLARLTQLHTVGQVPTALAVGADGVFGHISLVYQTDRQTVCIVCLSACMGTD